MTNANEVWLARLSLAASAALAGWGLFRLVRAWWTGRSMRAATRAYDRLLRDSGRQFLAQDDAAAFASLEQARILVLEMGDAADEWQVWRETSRAHQFCGEWETAIEVMEQALPVARRVNELTEAATHYELGALHARLRQFDQALAEYERARDIYRTAGQRDQEATTVNAMGVGYLDQGEYEQAEAAFDQALGMYASGQRDARVVTLCNLGDTYTDQARFEEARRVYRRGRSLARWTQNGEGQVYALRGMGRVEEALGRYRAAAHRYRQALTASRQYHGRADGAEMRFHVGMAYHKMGRDGRAWRWFERSRASFRKAGSRFAEAEPLMGMGLVCRSRGETAAALAYFRQALALAQADARFELERDLHDHIASLGAEPPEA